MITKLWILGKKQITSVWEQLREFWFESWRFTEFGSDNVRVVREEEEILKVRWTFRQEMRHLLRLCEFRVLAEYSDFEKSPPSCGKEQVWVAAKNG
jgi:hypothetical protein